MQPEIGIGVICGREGIKRDKDVEIALRRIEAVPGRSRTEQVEPAHVESAAHAVKYVRGMGERLGDRHGASITWLPLAGGLVRVFRAGPTQTSPENQFQTAAGPAPPDGPPPTAGPLP